MNAYTINQQLDSLYKDLEVAITMMKRLSA